MERKDERCDCKSDKRSEDRFSPPARRQISDRRRAVVMLEALACEYASNVVPAYYEIALKTKAARDEESQGMLDIIFNNRVIDLGDSTFCGELRDGAMRQLFDSKKNTLASRAKSLEKIMKIKLRELPGVGDAE